MLKYPALSDVDFFLAGFSDERNSKHPKPQARKIQLIPTHETPRGLIRLNELIELVHNYQTFPDEWTAEELAERFQLRESDVRDLINNFQLIKPEDRIINS